MAAKVSFDPGKREITVTQAPVNGIITLDVQVDLYSDGKEDWLTDPSLQVASFPIEPIGGNPIPGREPIGDSYILLNGWHIHPYEANHELVIVGNLFTETPPVVVDPVGSWNIRVTQEVSTLVELRESDQAIEFLSWLYKFFRTGKRVTDKATGLETLYDTDLTTVLDEWDIFEDVAESQRYRDQGINVRQPKQ